MEKATEKTPFWKSFYRSQFASIVATAADFAMTIALKEFLGIWYVIANYVGAITGAIISFLLGRNWAFNRTGKKWEWQAMRYGITSFLSVNINTYGVWLLTENFDLHYTISKIIVAIIVGVTFNFFMFRYFVFR